MTNFALITEGDTDKPIIYHVITEFCSRKFDDVFINPLYPAEDLTDANRIPREDGKRCLNILSQIG